MLNRNLVENRKLAFVWLKKIFGIPESLADEITALADALGGQFGLKDALRGLRDGTLNPTEQLIDAVKNKSFIGDFIPEADIQANLINPFKPEEQG